MAETVETKIMLSIIQMHIEKHHYLPDGIRRELVQTDKHIKGASVLHVLILSHDSFIEKAAAPTARRETSALSLIPIHLLIFDVFFPVTFLSPNVK